MTAWDLHRAWPEASFEMIPDASHSVSEPGIAAALVAATDRFAADAAPTAESVHPGGDVTPVDAPADPDYEQHLAS
jgi:proline iminopeptidase